MGRFEPTLQKADLPSHQYAVAIVDCLRPLAHISHYGIREAVNAARRIDAQRTYLTGFAHEVSPRRVRDHWRIRWRKKRLRQPNGEGEIQY